MTSQERFRCPHCGFRVYNRRVAKCESCGELLPAELLFDAQQKQKLNEEFERNKKLREERKKREREQRREITWGGEAGSFGDGDGGGGDGGGGD